MSKSTPFKSDYSDTDALLKEFFKNFNFYIESDKNKITRAWELLCLNSKEKQNDFYYLHPMRVAYILAESKFDSDCITAGILHSAFDIGITEESLQKEFGNEVTRIIRGTSRMINLPSNTKTLQQADAIRKMLFAMADDVRVIFVKLADKLDAIRNIKALDPQLQRLLAAEVIDIWAPLADRLGMSKEKNEFEDLSLKYTNPDAFRQIKAVISQKKEERAAYLEEALQAILKEAKKAEISVTITSRAKHFYSIYQKMRKRNKEAGDLYDLLALRIICSKNSDCYAMVGIVHSLWKPLEGRFKDYIAMPKANGYQSLHTTVMCKDRPLEIQIRTQQMHDIAEHGVASHWIYKKGTNKDLVDINKLSIFNQLQELKEKDISDESFFQKLKNDLLKDEIVVFTPKGDVRQLPSGATAIDFAYAIHSAIGEKIVGAKADGKIIPITKELKNTQIIEILTNPQAHPTESQLKAVKTSKAKQKIHAWLTANEPAFVDKVTIAKQEANAEQAIYSRAVQAEKRRHKKGLGKPSEVKSTGKVRISGTTNFLVTFAKCCSPTYPDPIVGYVSTGRGIVIHRADCRTFQRIPDIERRTIEVEWDTEKSDLQKNG